MEIMEFKNNNIKCCSNDGICGFEKKHCINNDIYNKIELANKNIIY